MKTLISFFNGKTEKASISEFQNSVLSYSAMNKVVGGNATDPTTDIWLPDDDGGDD